MTAQADERVLTANAGDRLALIVDSHLRLTGRPLLGDAAFTPAALWNAPFVLLAHGTEADPLFFYGNRLALDLFELSPEALMTMPSRLSAEAVDRAERARLLDQVSRQGFIADYAGVRVSATGRRFRIERATVWEFHDAAGRRCGQAAAIPHWTPLSA